MDSAQAKSCPSAVRMQHEKSCATPRTAVLAERRSVLSMARTTPSKRLCINASSTPTERRPFVFTGVVVAGGCPLCAPASTLGLGDVDADESIEQHEVLELLVEIGVAGFVDRGLPGIPALHVEVFDDQGHLRHVPAFRHEDVESIAGGLGQACGAVHITRPASERLEIGVGSKVVEREDAHACTSLS